MASRAISVFEACAVLDVHLTHERRCVAAILDAAPGPHTPADIRSRIHACGFRASQSSIERFLRQLKACGVIAPVAAGDGGRAYVTRDRPAHVELIRVEDRSRRVVADLALVRQVERALRRRGLKLAGAILLEVSGPGVR